MPKTKQEVRRRLTPASDPEARENQMIAYAIDLAEEQLRNGTARSQIITHYLRLATERERLERENLRSELELKRAKKMQIEAQAKNEELYLNAIKAMQEYAMPRYDDVGEY